LRRYYALVDFVHWNGFGSAGGLDGAGAHLSVSALAFTCEGAAIDPDKAFVWGWSPGGDMLIWTQDDRGGWLNLGSHKVHLLGTIGDTIDWVYSELLAGRCPEMAMS
jgi:hypothetical protein